MVGRRVASYSVGGVCASPDWQIIFRVISWKYAGFMGLCESLGIGRRIGGSSEDDRADIMTQGIS